MSHLLDSLRAVPLFRAVPDQALVASMPHWSGLSIPDGEILWKEDAPAWQLALLVRGRMQASSELVDLGEISAGEMLGEAAAFFRGVSRSATVRARGYSQVLTLSSEGLRELRRERNPVYLALLDGALVTLTRRIRASSERVARLAAGDQPAPARKDPGLFGRMMKALSPGLPKEPCPPVDRLLRQQPGLDSVEDGVIRSLAGLFTPEPVEAGRVLFLEGENADSGWLIASGKVDVLRNVKGDRAERLVTLQEGDSFGLNSLVEAGPRSASCVATTPTWLYRVDADRFAAPEGDTRMFWRESVLATLATQIRSANLAVKRASRVPPGQAPESFRELLRASGLLESLPLETEERVRLSVHEP